MTAPRRRAARPRISVVRRRRALKLCGGAGSSIMWRCPRHDTGGSIARRCGAAARGGIARKELPALCDSVARIRHAAALAASCDCAARRHHRRRCASAQFSGPRESAIRFLGRHGMPSPADCRLGFTCPA